MSATSNSTGPSARLSYVAPMQFLVFVLGRQQYGVDVQKVLELRGGDGVRAIDGAPAFVAGVVDVRGNLERTA